LTCEEYSKKLCDLFLYKRNVSSRDVMLLRFGRHFRVGGRSKIVVGRNEAENKFLLSVRDKWDYCFELSDVVGPTTLLQGFKSRRVVERAAQLTAFYSDAKVERVRVGYGRGVFDKSLMVSVPSRGEVDSLRVGQGLLLKDKKLLGERL
jgi:hypothetical protein